MELNPNNLPRLLIVVHGTRWRPRIGAVARVNRLLRMRDSGKPEQTSVAIVVDLADVMLRIELDPELRDEIDLGLKEVDVLLLIMHQLLEQVTRHIVLH